MARDDTEVDRLLRQDGFVTPVFDPQQEEAKDIADFQQFVTLRRGRLLSDLFDADFLRFCRWLRLEVHGRMGLSLSAFRAINRREALHDIALLALTAAALIVLRVTLPPWTEWLWGPPMLLQCVAVYRRESMLHARMHYIANMTEWPLLDRVVDALIMAVLGMSKDAFYRRHIDEHLSHVSNMARVFGEDWQPFDDLPAVWWLKPWLMVSLLLDGERMRKERFSYGQLIYECVVLHAYLAAVATELFLWRSHVLLLYHTLPAVLVTGARLMTGMLTHSGVDARNSFNSCGLFDAARADGLFRVGLTLIEFLSHAGVSAHPIHHAYSQCPVPVLLPRVKEITEHALRTYPDTRLNRVLSHDVYADLLARLPPPRWFDYVVQFGVACAALLLATLVILGLPYPPILFELAFVDYRVFFVSTKAERYWDSVDLVGRAKRMTSSNGYLIYVLANYHRMRTYLREHPEPVPRRLYAPRAVYDHNVGAAYVDAWLAGA